MDQKILHNRNFMCDKILQKTANLSRKMSAILKTSLETVFLFASLDLSTQNTYNWMSISFKNAQPLPFYNKKGFWYILCGGHLEKWPPCWIFRWLMGFSQKVGSRHYSCQIWCLYHKVNNCPGIWT